MSSFDTPLIVETGECAFCPSPIEAIEETDTLVAAYQILIEDGAPYLVCQKHWYAAVRSVPVDRISVHTGVHVLHA